MKYTIPSIMIQIIIHQIHNLSFNLLILLIILVFNSKHFEIVLQLRRSYE